MNSRLLLISGSLRAASTSSAALRTLRAVLPRGVSAEFFGDLAALPHFNPDDDADPLHPAVAALRAALHASDALVVSTPEYAGALPGSFKNLLDWTIGDAEPGSIYEKPVAWLNTSARGARGAHEELRTVLRYAHAAIVDAACLDLPVTNADLSPSGLVAGRERRERIANSVRVLVEYVARRTAEQGRDWPSLNEH